MICAAVTLSAIEDLNDNIDTINNRANRQLINYDDSDDYEAAAGWLVFVAVMGMVIEPLLIIIRILNISYVNQYFLIFGIGVSNYHGTMQYDNFWQHLNSLVGIHKN